ncbi:TPA: hypothetical protein ACIBXN_004521, partial [Salmonella enterica subsp. diarizonae serovar 48:i:z]
VAILFVIYVSVVKFTPDNEKLMKPRMGIISRKDNLLPVNEDVIVETATYIDITTAVLTHELYLRSASLVRDPFFIACFRRVFFSTKYIYGINIIMHMNNFLR